MFIMQLKLVFTSAASALSIIGLGRHLRLLGCNLRQEAFEDTVIVARSVHFRVALWDVRSWECLTKRTVKFLGQRDRVGVRGSFAPLMDNL